MGDLLEGNQREAREIAERLGTDPSWHAIRTYLEVAFEPGISREEVREILTKVGPYKESEEIRTWDSDLGRYVYVWNMAFIDPITKKHIVGYGFEFDEQGRLIAAGYIDFPW